VLGASAPNCSWLMRDPNPGQLCRLIGIMRKSAKRLSGITPEFPGSTQ
jgi:hypothetical protein